MLFFQIRFATLWQQLEFSMNVIFTQISFEDCGCVFIRSEKKKFFPNPGIFELNGFLIQQVKVHLFKLNVLQANRKVSVSSKVCQSECKR